MKKWSSGNHPTRRQSKHAIVRTNSCCKDTYKFPSEILLGYYMTKKKVQGKTIKVFVGPTLEGYAHACSAEDIYYLLEHIPRKDFEDLAFVLAQPLKKMTKWFPSWGCMLYATNLNTKKTKDFFVNSLHEGPAVFIFANNLSTPFKWSKSLSNYDKDELERLKAAGHKIEYDANNYYITRTWESVRNTQLFTLLHEIGHHVQRCSYYSEDLDLYLYNTIPQIEKEKFANRYADNFLAKFRELSIIPFPKLTPETFQQYLDISKKDLENNNISTNNLNNNISNNSENNTESSNDKNGTTNNTLNEGNNIFELEDTNSDVFAPDESFF